MKKKVLVVDDDPQICQLLSDILEDHGFLPLAAGNTDDAFKKLYAEKPDLIILDVWLPTIGGLEFCRQVRQDERVAHTPIIMLTARDKEVEKVMGLEMGADDYMTKPFGTRELLARIKALLRRLERAVPAGEAFLTSGDLALDQEKHLVRVKSRAVALSPKEFDLLAMLLQKRGKAVGRQSLLTTVWGHDAPGDTGTIDVHIRHLRRKLGPQGTKIKTVVGFGYRFDG